MEIFKNWRYLRIGDRFQTGDEYGYPDFKFVIGTKDTGFKHGDLVTEDLMCYNPRRKINIFRL